MNFHNSSAVKLQMVECVEIKGALIQKIRLSNFLIKLK